MIKRRTFLQGAGLAAATAALAGPGQARAGCAQPVRGTGDMGVIIERATGSVQIVETTGHTALARITGLGDLSHASVTYSRDQRYAYVFGRDGGLSKIDILEQRLAGRVIQAGNSIGGAISDDGRLIAVSNYKPGGVRIFRADTLAPVATIPARYGANGDLSKVVGLTDAPGNRFVFTLYDAGEIWIAGCTGCLTGKDPQITRLKDIGQLPYDALISPTGRYYIAGLFGEDGMALVDLWQRPYQVRRILDGYGRGEKKLPVYKMPHLEGWTSASGHYYLPAVGHHNVIVADAATFRQTATIPVHGQPIFVMARPDERQVWVNFAHPLNDTLQVIDVPSGEIIKQFTPGKAVLHMEFTARGEQVWVSVRDEHRIEVYDTNSLTKIAELPARAPSGIFFTTRAGRIGL